MLNRCLPPGRGTAPLVVFLACTLAAAAPARGDEPDPHVVRARALMQELRAESRRDAERIRAAYGDLGSPLADRSELAAATGAGIIRPLPLDGPFNVRPRMAGAHPIGEFDREYQHLYAAAQPSTLGLLLQIAAQVRSTAPEVTSLVRHQAYQRRLGQANPNARTSLATHTFGLAFDISILNVSNASAREIRDVLRRLRDAGDLFFVAEVRQLVFHVVVAPARAPFHAAVFDALVTAPPPAWLAQPLPAELARAAVVPVPPAGTPTVVGASLPTLLLGGGAAAAVWRRRKARRP